MDGQSVAEIDYPRFDAASDNALVIGWKGAPEGHDPSVVMEQVAHDRSPDEAIGPEDTDNGNGTLLKVFNNGMAASATRSDARKSR